MVKIFESEKQAMTLPTGSPGVKIKFMVAPFAL